MRIARTILCLAALALGTTSTQAATITYVFSGLVESCPVTGIPPCGDILFEGDSVSGPFVLDASSVAPLTDADYTEFVSFSTMVGQFFSVNSGNSNLVAGTVKFDSLNEINAGFLVILAAALPNAPPTRITLNLSQRSWVAEVVLDNMDPIFIAGGSGGFKMQPIPLPGALAMFFPALLALGLLRARANASA